MSQQGAEDWWQKLYDDPDAGPEPDPGDTLDQRFRSAATLMTGPAPDVPSARRAPEPDPPWPPAPPGRVPPARPSSDPPPPPPRRTTAEPPPESGEPARDTTPAPAAPSAPAFDGPPAPVAPPGVVPPVAQPGRSGRPDPRVVGETGYARGDVVVPPVEGAGGAPPVPLRPPSTGPVGPDVDEPGAPEVPDAPGSPYGPRPAVRHLGDRAPTYAPEPGALPAADPAALDFLTPDTVMEGARYGTYTLRAASLRGDSARFRGEARRDLLLTARFGSGDDGLVLVVLAGGDRAAPGAREAAAELGHSVAAAVGRSRERLADDIRAGRREALLSGLQRLTDRGYGRLRARAAELGLAEEAYTAGLRGLLLPLDPACRNRVCFGAGAGGFFRLRAGRWQDLEPDGPASGAFRFRAAVARPGDTLLLCSGGLADPMREEGLLADELAARWSQGEPPGLAAFLADTQLRLKGYADDRTAAAVWEA
ncbi:protein phosphatase 2C domain-containing protein [Streptomyces sp. SPB4]|uniref:protein phosphatase 2C domain-containing protein n=1 Tax=Streptomyces sp. SPB4 TaxID=2940553 RepID=UPI0024743AC4|nr:protein phosphatase 2C domain-containing protein [Streptomyces sp. SPB4]